MAAYDKSDLERRMAGAVEALKHDLAGLRTGRASTALLDPVTVEVYGSHMPLTQVATEVQLITLLDNLKCITDDPRKPDLDMSYEDVIFVIEEIDTDPRGICLQRPDPDEARGRCRLSEEADVV